MIIIFIFMNIFLSRNYKVYNRKKLIIFIFGYKWDQRVKPKKLIMKRRMIP